MPKLTKLELDRFCNFIWWWMTRNAQNQQDVDKLKAKLWMPPKNELVNAVADKRSPWSPEAETAAFGALKASLTK